MKISLIIVTYNQPDALRLVLKSIKYQSIYPQEVIIADDGSTTQTKSTIDSIKINFPIPLIHVHHKDKGYRISAIRNLAIKKSRGNYLIFSDGDLILHHHFIKDFIHTIKKGEALIGSRVFLTKKATKNRIKSQITNQVLPFFSIEIEKNRLNSLRIRILNKIFKPLSFSPILRGGLLGIWKEDLIFINGWNEDFYGWGYEDTEFINRLINSGIIVRKIKFQAITYHLWHKQQSRNKVSINKELLKNSIIEKKIKCKNGLTKFKK